MSPAVSLNSLLVLSSVVSSASGLIVPKPLATDIDIPEGIGFTTIDWGNEGENKLYSSKERITKKQAKKGIFTAADCRVSFKTLMEGGVTFVETSPKYGKQLRGEEQSAEHLVAQGSAANWKKTPVLSTKYNPVPILQSSGSVVKSLEKSLERLETSYVDLYQVDFQKFHFLSSKSKIADGLATCIDRGLCTNVGVCNLGAGALQSFASKLEDRGANLSTNQVEFSLVNRQALFDGTLEMCEDLGVLPLATNPLGNDLASGVYTASNPTGGRVGQAKYDFNTLGPLKPLHDALADIRKVARDRMWDEFYERKEANNRNYKLPPISGDFDREVTTTQISLMYVKAKGLVPLMEVRNKRDALELLGVVGYSLTEDEVKVLDKAAAKCGL